MSHSLAWNNSRTRVEDTDRAADQTPLCVNVILQSRFLKGGEELEHSWTLLLIHIHTL